jgi:hypothetical protein
MTKQYDNENRGQIWGNKKKTKDTHPDFTGSINIEGREYYLDGWKRAPDAPATRPAMTFRVKPKDEDVNRVERFQQAVKASFPGDDDDYIPFAPEWR